MKFNTSAMLTGKKLQLALVFLLGILLKFNLESHEKSINIGFQASDPGLVISDPTILNDFCLYPQEVYGTALQPEITTIYTGAAVEPTLAVNPKNSKFIVAAWEQDVIGNGGGLECGIAFSRDGGNKWRRTIVPFQKCLGGITQRISNVWLSYAKDGKRVYLISQIMNANYDSGVNTQSGIAVSISYDDGANWTTPTILFSSQAYINEPTATFPLADKPSITADRNLDLNAYSVWDTFDNADSTHSATYFSATTSGGRYWKPTILLYDPALDPSLPSNGIAADAQTTDNVIVVLPKADGNDRIWQEDDWGDEANKAKRFSGDLLNFMERIYAAPNSTNNQFSMDTWPYSYTLFDIAVTRSSTEGRQWSQTALQINSLGTEDPLVYTGGYAYTTEGEIIGGVGQLLRTGDVYPSYNVNPKNGFLYVVYQTGQLRADGLPVIALQTSRDGGYTWSDLAIVNKTPPTSLNPQAFTPFVAVDDKGHVGVLYYDTRFDMKTNPLNTPTDAWLAIYKEVRNSKGGSTGVGLDFVKEDRLTRNSFNAQNGPQTTGGIMSVGDYIFLDAKGKDFYSIFNEVLKGPYNPPSTVLVDSTNFGTIEIDDNLRQFPFFSKNKQ